MAKKKKRYYTFCFTTTTEQISRLRKLPNASEFLRPLIAKGLAELDGMHIKEMKKELETLILKYRLMSDGDKRMTQKEGVSDAQEFWDKRIEPLQKKIGEAEW